MFYLDDCLPWPVDSGFPAGMTPIRRLRVKRQCQSSARQQSVETTKNLHLKLIGKIIKTGELPSKLINEKEVTMITDEQILNETISKVFEEGKNAVVDTKKNSNAINFLLGKVMMATRGRADPKITMKLIKQKLEQI